MLTAERKETQSTAVIVKNLRGNTAVSLGQLIFTNRVIGSDGKTYKDFYIRDVKTGTTQYYSSEHYDVRCKTAKIVKANLDAKTRLTENEQKLLDSINLSLS